MKYRKGKYYSVDFSKELPEDQLGKYIWICNENNKSHYSFRVIEKGSTNRFNVNDDSCFNKNDSHAWSKSKLATPEEIQWLNLCIEQDKYIPFEEALLFYTHKSDSSLEPIYKKLLNIN